MTPAELLRDLIEEYLEEFEEGRAQAEEEMDDLAPLRDKAPKKVKVKKPVKPKKKSFVTRKATITKKRDEVDEEDVLTIQNTPKFRLLELARSMDLGMGINPDKLYAAAEKEGISRPRLQVNKMVRRGILYVHIDRVHVT